MAMLAMAMAVWHGCQPYWLADVRICADAHISCILIRNKVNSVSGGEGEEGESF